LPEIVAQERWPLEVHFPWEPGGEAVVKNALKIRLF